MRRILANKSASLWTNFVTGKLPVSRLPGECHACTWPRRESSLERQTGPAHALPATQEVLAVEGAQSSQWRIHAESVASGCGPCAHAGSSRLLATRMTSA